VPPWTALTVVAAHATAGHAAAPATPPARAESYKVGERVEVRTTPSKDVWELGVVTGFTYDTGQLVARWAVSERAFVDKDVRHLPAPRAAAEPTSVRDAMARMVNATPPDDGPVPAGPTR
jgi:hypothetical protein